jgi:hypothetical protein
MIKIRSSVLAGAAATAALTACGPAAVPLPVDTRPAVEALNPGGETAEQAAQPGADLLTVQVQVTKDGFEPQVVAIPQGVRVRVVLTNSDGSEHHFHVAGLHAGEAKWLASGGHDHGQPATYSDTHPCNHFCPTGICYTKNTLHAYAAPGGHDEVIFTALEKGTFIADDPFSASKATVRVY